VLDIPVFTGKVFSQSTVKYTNSIFMCRQMCVNGSVVAIPCVRSFTILMEHSALLMCSFAVVVLHSTVGIIPGIRTLATRPLPVNLAVSLHAARDDLRNELVPINTRYPLSDLIAACQDYLIAKRRRVTFEWALIDKVNDTDRDAHELAPPKRKEQHLAVQGVHGKAPPMFGRLRPGCRHPGDGHVN
jgi:hypothetical protein